MRDEMWLKARVKDALDPTRKEFPVRIEYAGMVWLKIERDGSITYADGYEPDEDDRRFWEAAAAKIVAALASGPKEAQGG